MAFKHLPMLGKILCLLGLLTAVVVVAVGYTTTRMKAISGDFGRVIEGPGVAAVDMERASKNIQRAQTARYKLVSISDPDCLAAIRRASCHGRRTWQPTR